ncbi:uncharacterized protein LOC110822974 [Carica papaya]|uniref:uncharacterized protein LOC110822974 n=1 Tax=Carica papaya TaxID=3649 RepID=UPI000B8CA1D9|nr:uncharacterized protein LOC110822974 [Carica papaya]
MKQKLCDDLNQLVQESSNFQYARLEELKRRIEALNPSRASTSSTQISTTIDTSAMQHKTEPGSRTTENIPTQGNDGNIPVMNGHERQLIGEGEARKKRGHNQGRGRGIGAVPKGRGPAGPGWTGAGFDVDGRTY